MSLLKVRITDAHIDVYIFIKFSKLTSFSDFYLGDSAFCFWYQQTKYRGDKNNHELCKWPLRKKKRKMATSVGRFKKKNNN